MVNKSACADGYSLLQRLYLHMIDQLFDRGERDESRRILLGEAGDRGPDPEPGGEHGGVVSSSGETYGTRGPKESSDDENGIGSVVPSHCRRPRPGELEEESGTRWVGLRSRRQAGGAVFIDDPDRPGANSGRFCEAANCFLSRPRADVYDCPLPYEFRDDVVAPYLFEGVVREFDRVENLTSYEFTPAAAGRRAGVVRHCRQHPLDRDGYHARVLDRLDSWWTPDWAPSTSPDRVERGDGQAGLDDFDREEIAPCGSSEVRGCDCCRCPACGIKSIRARGKTPKYACNGPECDATFEEPVVRPARR